MCLLLWYPPRLELFFLWFPCLFCVLSYYALCFPICTMAVSPSRVMGVCSSMELTCRETQGIFVMRNSLYILASRIRTHAPFPFVNILKYSQRNCRCMKNNPKSVEKKLNPQKADRSTKTRIQTISSAYSMSFFSLCV